MGLSGGLEAWRDRLAQQLHATRHAAPNAPPSASPPPPPPPPPTPARPPAAIAQLVLDRQDLVHQLRGFAADARELFSEAELRDAGILESVQVGGWLCLCV